MDYGDPIHFTFFAVNGAGNGAMANLTYLLKKQSGYYFPFHFFCWFLLFLSIYCIPLCLLMDYQIYKGYDNCFVSSQAFTHLGCSYKVVVPFQISHISIGHQRNDFMMTTINVPITPIASSAPQSMATINYAIGRSGMYCAHLCTCILMCSLWISVWSISVGDFSSCVCGVCDCLHKT